MLITDCMSDLADGFIDAAKEVFKDYWVWVLGYLAFAFAIVEFLENDTRGFAFLLTIPLVALGLYLANKRTDALTKQSETDSDRLLAETFAKSIELLGSEKKEVQQGAIYALGKIAATNPAELPAIVNTLCAFIRHNKLRQLDQTTNNLSIDIEAAVKVISTISQDRKWRDNQSEREHDLSNIHLSYADFSGANLSHFNLSDSVFKKCIFENVKFFNSNLVSSKFKGSNFKGAKFDEKTETKGADFSKAKNLNQTWQLKREVTIKTMDTRKSALDWCEKIYDHELKNIRASRIFKPNNASVKERCWWVEFSESKMIKDESQNLLLQKDFDDDGEFHHLKIPNEFLIKNKDGLGYRQDIASFSFMISAEEDSFMNETRGKDKINLREFIQKNNKS